MTSKIKVDQLEGSTGNTITIPSGTTLDISSATFVQPTVPTNKGGTGLTSIGTAGQVIKVNAGATGLEYGDADLNNLNASNLTSGTVPSARLSLIESDIPNLSTGKTTSGTFNSARIPNLDATTITTGTLSNDRLNLANITDTGTAGTKISTGTTAQRGDTVGQLRYNTSTGKFEYREGSGWVEFFASPTITSVDDTEVDSQAGGNQTFVITGANFSAGAVIKFIGSDATEITATTTTVDSSTQITAVIAKSSFVNAKEPYDVKVINGNSLTAQLDNIIYVDNTPTWSTASGSLGIVYFGTNASITVTATDVDSDTVTYSLIGGALPSGLSLNANTGVISGTVTDVGSSTVSSFTLRATANSKTVDRAFSITANPNTSPSWVTASGTIDTIYDGGRTGYSFQLQATDNESDPLTYTITSGSLPTGLSLSSAGLISGTATEVGSNTTSNFDVQVTDGISPAVTRSFALIVNAPSIQAFTTAGSSGTWTAPFTGNIKVLAVGGCGAYGAQGGLGGAGAVCYNPSFPVVAGTSYAYAIGKNGYYLVHNSGQSDGSNGSATTFSTINALGGCGGAEGSQANGSVQINGGANEGSYMGQVGVQAYGCYHRNQTLGTPSAGEGGTVYAGRTTGQSQLSHYNWNTAGSAGAGGNGNATPNCGGNGQGGVGVDVNALDSLFGAYAVSNIMACGRSGSGYYGTTPQITGYGSYGSPKYDDYTFGGGCLLLKL